MTPEGLAGLYNALQKTDISLLESYYKVNSHNFFPYGKYESIHNFDYTLKKDILLWAFNAKIPAILKEGNWSLYVFKNNTGLLRYMNIQLMWTESKNTAPIILFLEKNEVELQNIKKLFFS